MLLTDIRQTTPAEVGGRPGKLCRGSLGTAIKMSRGRYQFCLRLQQYPTNPIGVTNTCRNSPHVTTLRPPTRPLAQFQWIFSIEQTADQQSPSPNSTILFSCEAFLLLQSPESIAELDFSGYVFQIGPPGRLRRPADSILVHTSASPTSMSPSSTSIDGLPIPGDAP